MHPNEGRFISSNITNRAYIFIESILGMFCHTIAEKATLHFSYTLLTLTYISTTISSTTYIRSEIIIIVLPSPHAINTHGRPSHSSPCHPQIIMSSDSYPQSSPFMVYSCLCPSLLTDQSDLLCTILYHPHIKQSSKYHIIYTTPTKCTLSKHILIGLT